MILIRNSDTRHIKIKDIPNIKRNLSLFKVLNTLLKNGLKSNSGKGFPFLYQNIPARIVKRILSISMPVLDIAVSRDKISNTSTTWANIIMKKYMNAFINSFFSSIDVIKNEVKATNASDIKNNNISLLPLYKLILPIL